MEGLVKKQDSHRPASLSIHKESQNITKVKPKIRIIHIFAPEIIKTDVQNFRELVQRLTGKQQERVLKKVVNVQRDNKKVEIGKGVGKFASRGRAVKEEEEDVMWNGVDSGGFLSGLNEMDFEEFPFIALDGTHLQLRGFEESRVS